MIENRISMAKTGQAGRKNGVRPKKNNRQSRTVRLIGFRTQEVRDRPKESSRESKGISSGEGKEYKDQEKLSEGKNLCQSEEGSLACNKRPCLAIGTKRGKIRWKRRVAKRVTRLVRACDQSKLEQVALVLLHRSLTRNRKVRFQVVAVNR